MNKNEMRNLDEMKMILNFFIKKIEKKKCIYYCVAFIFALYIIDINWGKKLYISSLVTGRNVGNQDPQSEPPKIRYRNNPKRDSSFKKINLSPLPEYHPWSFDPECSDFVTRFGNNLRKTILLSYSDGLMMWVRYLLEGATGIFTGSIYNDTYHYEHLGFLGERESAKSLRTIVQQAHSMSLPHLRSPNIRTILIISCPASSIVTNWHWQKNQKYQDPNMRKPLEADYTSIKFHSFVAENIETWKSLNTFALTNLTRLLPILYDELVQNPKIIIRQMLGFLNIFPDEERLTCLQKHLRGRLQMRPPTLKLNHYSNNERKLLSDAINDLQLINNFSKYSLDLEYCNQIIRESFIAVK